MPAPSSREYGRSYVAYSCLLLLFAIAVTNQSRAIGDGLDLLLHGSEHVRDPFEINGPELAIFGVQPEARAAGIKDRDLLTGVGGQSPRGFTDYYSVLRQARPGQQLRIEARRELSLELQPAFSRGASTSAWLSFAITTVAIPLLCFGLGFWVVAVRIRDKVAWLLLALLLSFAEMFGASGYTALYGRTDLLQPAFAAYHSFASNLFSSALLLFALYFPEQLNLDRRFPWAKWVVIGPLLCKVVTDAIYVSLVLHRLAAARELWRVLGVAVDELSVLHLVAIALFFGILGYKTLTASGRISNCWIRWRHKQAWRWKTAV